MAGQSSDIELIAGLSGGGSISGKSGQRIKSQLDSIMGEINKKPFKINVELNEKNLTNFRQEFEKMARDARTAAERIESAFDGIEIGKLKGSDNVRDVTDNLTNRNKKLKQAYKELQAMERNLFKWSSSEKGKSASAFDDYLSQGVALERLIQQLENEEISLKDFSEAFVDIQAKASKASNEIAYFGENAAAVKKITEGTTEYLSAMEKVNKELKTAKANQNNWSASEGATGDVGLAYKNIENQILALDNLKTKLKEGSLTADQFAQQFAQIKLSLSGSYDTIISAGKNLSKSDELEVYAKQLKEVDSLTEQIEQNLKNWSKAKNGEGADAFKNIEDIVVSLKEMREALVKTGKPAADFSDTIAKAHSTLATGGAMIKDFDEDSKTFGDKVLGIAKEVSDYIDVMDIVFEAVAYGKRMVSAVTDIDTAMTELRKVTDETNATYASFLENASTRAEDFGATVADVVSASADFARLGHDLGDASALADAAIVYKNVGDGINDIDTASSSIISTMQAFGIEASNAMSIVDSFNAIGNNFAVSSQGVGDALLNSAASLAAAGNDIHEAVALIAAANTTIQDPGRVGKMFAQQHSNVLKEDSYIG